MVANHDSAWCSDGVTLSLQKLEHELRGVQNREAEEILADFFLMGPCCVKVEAISCDDEEGICNITW
jgi:hypothetical protein